MLVYHGTSLKRFEEIEKDKYIRRTSNSIRKVYPQSEPGYLYLAELPIEALDFGIRAAQQDINRAEPCDSVVLELELDENILREDESETERPTTTWAGTPLTPKGKYFKTNYDVPLKYVKRILHKCFANRQLADDFLDLKAESSINATYPCKESVAHLSEEFWETYER